MENETAIKKPNLEREAKKCLKDMRKMYDETGKLTRLFLSKKMHMHLGYKDTPRDIRKCLKEHLNDPSLYSTICRWIQAIRIEEALKLEHELWPLTVLLEFNRYEKNGWERIANQFADQEVPPTMNDFKKACVDLLNNQEIALRKTPRVTSTDSALLNFKKVLPQIDHNSLMTIMAEIQTILDKATTPTSEGQKND